MRMRFLAIALAVVLAGCSTWSGNGDNSYGVFHGEATASPAKGFSLKAEDRLMVQFIAEEYREERLLELTVRELLCSRGIDSLALTDIYSSEIVDGDRTAITHAVRDAEPDYIVDITLTASEEFPGGGLSRRDYLVKVKSLWSSREVMSLYISVQAERDEARSLDETLVPVARSFAKTLANELMVLYR